jgi:hypothetical protein
LNALVIGPGGYHFGDYWMLELPLLLIEAEMSVFESTLLAARSKSSELIGRYRVDRGKGHDQRVLGR